MALTQFFKPNNKKYKVQEMQDNLKKWNDKKQFKNYKKAEKYGKQIAENTNEPRIIEVKSYNY